MKAANKLALFAVLITALTILVSCGINHGQADKNSGDIATVEQEKRVSVGLFPASVKTVDGIRWGFIDKAGKFIIQPQYDRVRDFQNNGLAVVTIEDRSSMINAEGKFVVQPQYGSIEDFYEGLATAYDTKDSIVLDEQGQVIYRGKGFIGRFQNGRAVISQSVSDQWLSGYIDTQGNVVIEPKYLTAGDFMDGKAVVQLGEGRYAMIDRSGGVIKTFNYAFVGDISEGLMAYKEKNDGKFGFIDEKGNSVIKPKYTGIQAFNQGRAIVNISDDYSKNEQGLIDRTGKFLIKPKYNDIQDLGEGLYAVGIALSNEFSFFRSKYAIANKNGKFLTDFIYYSVAPYKNGLASVDNNIDTFFIDKTGKRVEKLPVLTGNGSLAFVDGIIQANVDMRIFYMEQDGRIIYRQNTKIQLDDRFSVNEIKFKPNRYFTVYYPQIKGFEEEATTQKVNDRLKQMSIPKEVDKDTDMDYSYEGDFSIELYQKHLLELKIWGYDYPFGAAHGMPSQLYVHVDLRNGQFYELKDLFKADSNYVKVLSDRVRKQIEAQGEASEVWMDSYKGVKEDQPFFITKDALYVYFLPYEIAPYAAGFPTFKIPFDDMMHIIDTQGAFWKSFN